jgi:DNA-binding beta-propeller fold protein YncE
VGAATPASASIATYVWESRGDPDQPLSLPGHLALAPDGNVWVSDPGHDQFQILSPDGAFLEAWGTSGSGPGQFDFRGAGFPNAAVAFAPDGSFYVADTGNDRVQKFAPNRSFVAAWGTRGAGPGQFRSATSVAVGPDGHVYVVDSGSQAVQVFDADGAYLRTIGKQGSGPGEFLLSAGADIAIDGDGNLWVSDTSNYRMQVFSADGELVAVLPNGPHKDRFGQPAQIAFDDAGRVFMVSSDPRAVQVVATDGTVIGSWGESDAADLMTIDVPPGTLLGPAGIVLDGDNNVYVSDVYRDCVIKFRLQPVFSAALGA